VFKNASHALLQEADINLAQLMKQEGFYVTKRRMSAPVKKRNKASFGSAAPIEKPTMGELDYYTEGYAFTTATAHEQHHDEAGFVSTSIRPCTLALSCD